MKKILSCFLVLCLLIQCVPCVLAVDTEDVNKNYITSEKFLKDLGVVAEPVDYNHTLSRGEAAKYIVKLISEEEFAISYRGIFKDVPSEHPYALYIEYLADKGIVKGSGDFKYNPDDKLNYNNVMIMFLNLLGYGNLENSYNMYPTWATELGLYKNLTREFDYVNMGDFLVIMNNVLHADMMIRSGYGDDKQYVISDLSLLDLVYNTEYLDGVIVKNDVTYLWSSDNSEPNTIVVDSTSNGRVEVKIANSAVASADIGKRVRLYYKYENDECKYIHHFVLNKNKTLNIDLSLIDLAYTDLMNKTIGYTQDKINLEKVKLSDVFYILYNGISYKSSTLDFSELKNKSGYLELIDNNSDSKFDVLNVKSYDTVIVKEIVYDEGIITDKHDANKKYYVNDKNYKRITVYDNSGNLTTLDKIVAGNILSIAASDSFSGENIIEIRISDKTKSGKITAFDNTDGIMECEIDFAEKHFVTDRAMNSNFIVGHMVVVYIDAFGKIVYVNVDYGREMQYGIVLKSAYRQTGNEDFVVMKMLTFDNNKGEYRVAEKVKVDGTYYKEEPSSVYRKLKAVQTKSDTFIISDDLIVIRFKLNDEGEISVIDTHNKGEEGATDDDLTLMANSTMIVTTGNVLGWSVPVSTNATILQLTATNYTDISTYTYHFASGSLSAGSEYSIAAFKSDPESPYADFAMMKKGGIGINNTLYGVKEVVEVYNEQEEAPMYKIKGYLKNTYTEMWIDTESAYTSGLTDLKFGDVIRVATDLDNRVFRYDKIVYQNTSGTNFVKVSGDSFTRDDTTTLTNAYGYIYKRDGSLVLTNKFNYGIIPEKPSDVVWETEELIMLNLVNTVPIIVFDSQRKTIEVGSYSDIKDYETYGDKASKILARYRNSQLQEVYIFN